MIQFEQVRKSYTGSIGCMCGCRGNYSIPSHYGIARANAEAGWNAHDKCSDRAVKMAVNRINKLIDWDDEDIVEKHTTDAIAGGKIAWFDTDTGRTVVVYYNEEN